MNEKTDHTEISSYLNYWQYIDKQPHDFLKNFSAEKYNQNQKEHSKF